MEVPFIDLKAQNRSLKSEIFPLWEEILESAGFIGGKHIDAFEDEFAKACNTRHCIAVNSGTDALRFILIALGLKSDDEVITVPNTFIATTEAITQAGGKPVFVDVDPITYNMDHRKLEAAITSRTKGIVPVHLYGQPADMDSILSIADKHGLWVVEDACQAHLAEYKGHKTGSFGTAGAFSFYPGKNLGACGESGAVTTNNGDLAKKVKQIRDHGQSKKYYHDIEGYNGRCDALQAAALRVKLKHLTAWNESRRKNANLYFDLLKSIDCIVLPRIDNNCISVFHLFVIQVENRNQVQKRLSKKGISTGLHYPIPLHLQKAYKYMNLHPGSFPITEQAAERLLSLPMYPELTKAQIRYVSEELISAINEGVEEC
ncbi:MAG: DegT/DnrJ/EryC1/StrS family aminotransferase [Desulfobacteraceae bacterium]|nr:DegT/DnrJ/EryC1/StrS family aminotransferase [Desulfobacteraceae bacterium]MBC2756747.1 DegT/DnrJ/EryC1/StrS family aminotransferase [Desulfobacteraceae bacterium]